MYSHSWQSCSFNFSHVQSFLRYINQIAIKLRTVQDDIHQNSLGYLNSVLATQPMLNIYELSYCSFFNHQWENGDIKLLPVPNIVLCVEDDFWHSHYPFMSQASLSRTSRYIEKHYTLKPGAALHHRDVADGPRYAVLLSHVNHYGHFVLDDLPFHLWPLSTPTNIWPTGLIQLTQSDIFTSELNQLMLAGGFKQFTHHIIAKQGLTSMANTTLIAPRATTFTVRHFLSQKIRQIYIRASRTNVCRSISNHIAPAHSVGARVFITRGPTNTRIHNYNEIVRFLANEGFNQLDLKGKSIRDLSTMLENVELIVAETGSASHIAELCTADDVPIICLIPSRLLSALPKGELFGCLSYYFAYLHRLTFVSGATVIKGCPVSSDIESYIEKLSQ